MLHHLQPQEIVLRCDQPWERSGPGYPTVFRDGDRYRLYYRVTTGHVDDGDQRQYTCYAESVDGITWRKPRLRLVEIEGSKDNNVIWTGAIAHNFSPFRDENPAADSSERYKAVGGVGTKWGDGFWLLVSPDGIRWYAWGLVETAPQFAGAPQELSLYVQERDKPSQMDDERGVLRRHTLRLDGFASLHAPLTGGTLVSRPLVFSGETLEINFATSAGDRIRIGLADASGEPIAGRSLRDCDLPYGDQIDRVVSWGGDDHLGGLEGRPVRLTVELKDADLYALRFR